MKGGRKVARALSKHRFLAIWLVIAVGMAVVYQGIWSYRPDYFRVQSDLNLRPIDLAAGVRGYRISSEAPLPAIHRADPQVAALRLQSAYEAMQVASGRLAANRRALRVGERNAEAGRAAFEASQWAQFDQYVRARTEPFDRRISELQATLAAMLRIAGVQSPDQLPEGSPLAVDYADLRVRLAEESLRRINAKAAAQNYALHHLEEFQRTPPQREHLRHRRTLSNLQGAIDAQADDLLQQAMRVREAEDAYRSAIGSRLTFFDFVYFSIGGATGSNFGDISPNHTSIRALYSLQILASIVLLTFALEAMMGGFRAAQT